MQKTRFFTTAMLVGLGMFAFSVQEETPAKSVDALSPHKPFVVATTAPTESLAELSPPAPAKTAVTAVPAPGRIEFPVSDGTLEVQVIEIERPASVYLGQDSVQGTEIRFKAGEGKMFLDIGIRVRNESGEDIPMKWTDIYMSNRHGDKWYPHWAVYQESDLFVDPLTFEILQYDQVDPEHDPDAHFYLAENGFVRAIFALPRNKLYYFLGFGNLNVIEIKNVYY